MSEIAQNEAVEQITEPNTRNNCTIDEITTINETSEQDDYQDKIIPSSGLNMDENIPEEAEQDDYLDNPSSSGLHVDKDVLDESFVEVDFQDMPSASGQNIYRDVFDEVTEADEFIEIPSSSGLNMEIYQELGTDFTIADFLDMCYGGTYQGFEQAIMKVAQAFARCTDGDLELLLKATEHMFQRTEEEYIILITDRMPAVFEVCRKKGPDQLKSVNERLICSIIHNAVICCLNTLFEEQFLTIEILQNVVLPCFLEFLHERPRYQLNAVPDYYYNKNRPIVGQIVIKCADLLDSQVVDDDVVPIFEEFICDDSDIHFTLLQQMALVFKSVSSEKRAYLLTKLNSFLRIESNKGWRLREEFADQCLLMCSSCSLSQINQFIICFALSFMDDRFDCVRQKAILLLSEILSTFICCEWPTSPDVDVDDLDSLLREMPLSKATILDIYGSFAHSTLWRRRQAFATLLIHVLQNEKSRVEHFGRLFGNDMMGIAKDRLPNIRLKFLSLWRCLHMGDEERDSFDELFPKLSAKLKEALEDMAVGDPDFEVQTQARISMNLIQPQKDSLDYGDHYRRLAERENKLWERLDEYREEHEKRLRRLNDNHAETTALLIESYVQDDRPKASSVKTIASNIQALFNNRRSPQTQKTPKRGGGGFKFVVSSVPENERSPPTYKASSSSSPEPERKQITVKRDDSNDPPPIFPIAGDEQRCSSLDQISEAERIEKHPGGGEFLDAQSSRSFILENEQPPICESSSDRSPEIEQRQMSPELPEPKNALAVEEVLLRSTSEGSDIAFDVQSPVSVVVEAEQPSLICESSLGHSPEGEQRRNSPELLHGLPESNSLPTTNIPESTNQEDDKSPDMLVPSSSDNEQNSPASNQPPETEQKEEEAVYGDVLDAQSSVVSVPENELSLPVDEPSLDHFLEIEPTQVIPELPEPESTSAVDGASSESTNEGDNSALDVQSPVSSIVETEQNPLTCEPSVNHSPEVEREENAELPELRSTSDIGDVPLESTNEEDEEFLDAVSSGSFIPENEVDSPACEAILNHSSEPEQNQVSSELPQPEGASPMDDVPLESTNKGNDSPDVPSPVPSIPVIELHPPTCEPSLNHSPEPKQQPISSELPHELAESKSLSTKGVSLESTNEDNDESPDAQSPRTNPDPYTESDC